MAAALAAAAVTIDDPQVEGWCVLPRRKGGGSAVTRLATRRPATRHSTPERAAIIEQR